MKAILLVMASVLALSACATSAPVTAWAKPGVSRQDFGYDVGMCTGLASQQGSDNGTNTAGGVSGRNNNTAGGAAPVGGGAGTVAGGTYQGMASSDYAQRAATQQRAQEMAAKRAQTEAYKSCLTQRGYQEIALSAEEAAKLAQLKAGSNEYYEYLYEIGSRPASK